MRSSLGFEEADLALRKVPCNLWPRHHLCKYEMTLSVANGFPNRTDTTGGGFVNRELEDNSMSTPCFQLCLHLLPQLNCMCSLPIA